MSKRLLSLSSSPELRQYAQRLAQSRITARANFLAPPVDVANPVGKYKIYTEKNRFRVPDTRRNSGGRAVELGFTQDDGTYNCEYHAVDVPADKMEEDATIEQATALAQEHLDLASDVQALSHEREVINKARAAAGAGTDLNFTSDAVDPVAEIDKRIEQIMLATAGTMDIRIAWGPIAFRLFKNNKNVRDRFKVGKGAGSSSGESITMESVRPLFMGEPEMEIFMMVEDIQPEGKDAELQFLMGEEIFVFASRQTPTRYDSSFMKTFRLSNQWMRPRIYNRDDGRVTVVAADWSEFVAVTNEPAVKRINAKTS